MSDYDAQKMLITGRMKKHGSEELLSDQFDIQVWRLAFEKPAEMLGQTSTRQGEFQFEVDVPEGLVLEQNQQMPLWVKVTYAGDVLLSHAVVGTVTERNGRWVINLELQGSPEEVRTPAGQYGQPAETGGGAATGAGKGGSADTLRSILRSNEAKKILRDEVRATAAESQKSKRDFEQELLNVAKYLPSVVDVTPGGYGQDGTADGGPGAGVAPLRSAVNQAVAAVLGRSFTSDPASIKLLHETLQRAFTPVDVGGRIEYRYNSAVLMPYQATNELGGKVSGAQASLLDQFSTTIARTRDLLQTVKPLIPAPDDVKVEASRIIVSSLLDELLRAVGREDGPQRPAVESLFAALKVELKNWRSVFGLHHELATSSLPREGIFTTFNTIEGNVHMLRAAWDQFIAESKVPFLGKQLINLAPSLDVVQSKVHRVQRTLNALRLGPSERRALIIDFGQVNMRSALAAAGQGWTTGPTSLSVEGLFEWVLDFVRLSQQLISGAGRAGVLTIEPMATSVAQYVRMFQQRGLSIPPLDQHEVQQDLEVLARQVERVAELAGQLHGKTDPDKPSTGTGSVSYAAA